MRKLSVFLLAMGCGGSHAFGGLSYSYLPDQPDYRANPGQSVSVQVYLKESVSDPTPVGTSLINDDGGLAGAGFSAQWLPESKSSTITAISFNSAIGAFDADAGQVNGQPEGSFWNQATFTSSSAWLQECTGLASPGVKTDASGQVLLGTLTIVAPTTPGEVAQFQIAPFSLTLDGYTVTQNSYYDLDFYASNDPAPPYAFTGAGDGGVTSLPTFTVTAIPEPTLLSLAMPAVLLLARRCRRSNV